MPHAPAPLPSLAPGETAVPTAWDCDVDEDGLGGEVGHHCVTTSYAVIPAAPAATVAEATYVCQGPTAPDGSCLAVVHPQQFTAVGFALVLIVVLLAALVVAQIRRARA
jgi:hypothetical protein